MRYKQFLKYFAINLLIGLAYDAVVTYFFITERHYNPIGAGLRFWFFVICHFVGIFIVGMFNETEYFKTLNILSLLLVVFLLLMFDTHTSKFIDSWRANYFGYLGQWPKFSIIINKILISIFRLSCTM